MTPRLSERIREDLAALEHAQWMNWAGIIMSLEPISADRRIRWEEQMVPYAELREAAKEPDREWADQVLNVINPEVEALEAKLKAAQDALKVICPNVGTDKCEVPKNCRRAGCRLPGVWAALGEDET